MQSTSAINSTITCVVDWCSIKFLDLYLGGTWFISEKGYKLF
jgi:hypothetical protein